jgi:hypothetical protein
MKQKLFLGTIYGSNFSYFLRTASQQYTDVTVTCK